MNVARHLVAQAAERGDDLAVQSELDGRRITFRELDLRSDRWGAALRAHGFQRGERVLVLVRAGVDLITLTYACFKAGIVPVLIDPGMGRAAFGRCVRQIAPSGMVGIPLAHAYARLVPGAFESVKRRVVVGNALGSLFGLFGPTLESLERATDPLLEPVAPEDEAAVLFTSGSTGPAKGVVYTHATFDAQLESLKALYGFVPGEIDCAAFPLFSLFDAALGMTSLIPPVNPSRPGTCDPERVVRTIMLGHATTAFGSPAVWSRVADHCLARAVRMKDLERIIIAGASVSPDLVLKLRMATDARIYTPYGATEALPVCNVESDALVGAAPRTAEGAGTFVGTTAPGVEVRIIPVDDGPVEGIIALPPGEVGEITVAGPVVTRAYAGLPDATRAAKVLVDGVTWHRMGDLGYLDADGALWVCGRKGERVETAQGPLYTDRVEGILNAMSGRRTALVGLGQRPFQRPALVVEGPADAELAERLRARMPALVGVCFKDRFPVDPRHNAKIHRLELAAWAGTRLDHA